MTAARLGSCAHRTVPSDAEIERGLRKRAVSYPRAVEILLRWLQRPRAEERVGGVDLDSMGTPGERQSLGACALPGSRMDGRTVSGPPS